MRIVVAGRLRAAPAPLAARDQRLPGRGRGGPQFRLRPLRRPLPRRRHGRYRPVVLEAGAERLGGGARRYDPPLRNYLRAARLCGEHDVPRLPHVPGGRVVIAHPVSRRRLDPGQIGEIGAAGPNIAPGYWQNSEATAEAFTARLAGETDETRWLRTGDLGFLDEAGELFITGRIKE